MKRIVSIVTVLILLLSATAYAAAIPDHSGTDLDQFEMGTKKLISNVTRYSDIFHEAGNQFSVDPNILAAVCMQESGGRNDINDDGLMQLTSAVLSDFSKFGSDHYGAEWTSEDRKDPNKSIRYAAYLISNLIYRYNGDYIKALQAYNFGWPTLNKIIEAKGDNWLSERQNAKDYVANWPYSSYGDAQYVEHILRYYGHSIEYSGARVRVNGELIRFSNQGPLVINDSTLVPVRSVSEFLGGNVDWDENSQCATITKGKTTVKLYIDSEIAYVNNDTVFMDTPALMLNYRTMVPIRFISEALGFDINWDQNSCTVEITS
ncbi:MAG: transglycosylase SLT domain-containing protein [Clostridia bacterium]|nr:transglycosylase SLT domain-containing protein [Clostridia bacterium]